MIEFGCPNCDERVQIEHDSYGVFECPHCRMDFEWESEPENFEYPIKTALKIFAISLIVISIAVFLLILIDGPGPAIEWTAYLLILGAPIFIPLALIPPCIYLSRVWLTRTLER